MTAMVAQLGTGTLTLAGAGALRSTAADMAKFVAANLAPPEGKLGEALKLAQQVRADNDDSVAMGLGWHITKASNTVWHNGQTGGYHSFVGFIPEKKFGVIVLANTATMHVDRVGDGLLRRLLDLPADRPRPPTANHSRSQRAGKIRGQVSDDAIVLAHDDARGRAAILSGDGPAEVSHLSGVETKFFWKVVDARVTFDVDGDGKITGLTLHQNGKDYQPAKRVE